jgi:hypothetical protein
MERSPFRYAHLVKEFPIVYGLYHCLVRNCPHFVPDPSPKNSFHSLTLQFRSNVIHPPTYAFIFHILAWRSLLHSDTDATCLANLIFLNFLSFPSLVNIWRRIQVMKPLIHNYRGHVAIRSSPRPKHSPQYPIFSQSKFIHSLIKDQECIKRFLVAIEL